MSNNAHQFTTSIHDGEVFLTYKGATIADAGVLFPSPAFSMWHINALVATLNAYFPTEPAQRFCASTQPAAPTPGDTEIVDWLENISSTAYPVKIGKTLSGQPWVVCESGHYPGSDLRDCLRAALQRPARDGGGR